MASYGALIRKITTAEINRVQREGGYSHWSYFVDERLGRAGAIFANNTIFAAYVIDDSPDPKLSLFGQEMISDLVLTPDADYLLLKAGANEFQASVFSDASVLVEDDFADSFSSNTAQSWQQFLYQSGVQVERKQDSSMLPRVILTVIGLLIVIFLAVALLG